MMNNAEDFSYLNGLEKKLSESLRPIRPDPTFVHSLKDRLAQGTSVIVEKPASHAGFLIIGIGLFTGALLLWLLHRSKS